MCQHFGYDPSYTSKLIKKFAGKTFKQMVNEERMKKAMILLQNKELPVYEIAQEVGIHNLTSFYKRFHEYSGYTPQERDPFHQHRRRVECHGHQQRPRNRPQLYQVIDVPASGSYRVTFKAKASMNREIRLALEKDGQSPLMDETMSVSADWTNYSYDFTVSSAASGVKLVFMLGNVGTTENMAHTISIDDISLYKVS